MATRPFFVFSRFPTATLTMLAVVALATAAALNKPHVLDILERSAATVPDREWWRLVTPLFVHDGGWPQIANNLIAGVAIGVVAEEIFGLVAWLVLFFAGGITGELAGLAWQPVGAGSSVGIAGLTGGLIAVGLTRPGLPIQPRIGAAILLSGAAVLIGLRDIHGPPVFAGLAAGLWLSPR
jgi:rhomboid protease GluP